ncbi:MAG: PAS domain-containing protein [Actinobacteria bacterium]|nr:PAS domain-containing protein [Actinomycetota bacterium]MSZ80684.1 PAS domain-containing protein [Actinomycetota bacterium]MTB13148.1 PAS domain-containing protein [Actinomycetota bacterium]
MPMSTIGELARQHTDLSKEQIGHLVNLASEWGMLADVCFADLLLYVPVEGDNWLVLAQVRAATGQTLYLADWVGSQTSSTERPLLATAMTTGVPCEGEIFIQGVVEDCRMMAIPVQFEGEVIAVLTREWSQHTGRQPGELERTYLEIFERFAEMIVRGAFPFVGRVADSSVAPRVGDGAIVLDADARVRYASPNATSALHRVGISANAVGQTLSELGVIDSSVRQAFERREPVVEEFEQTAEVTLLTRCIPIVDDIDGEPVVTGAVMLLRDVSELRRRDRLLLSKDATIREIHHRVKNNLQTISSLLRLQARRLESPEAKAAVAESVRRIRTIALVHETLSREPGDDVAFVEIVRPLLRLVEESLQSPERPMRFMVIGDGGRLAATVVTPLSVVLTELLQNAVDHGFPEGDGGGNVAVRLQVEESELLISVIDDGRGIPAGFKLADAKGLGLSIVRTLVTTELAGTIEMRPAHAEELAEVEFVPRDGNTGTVILLRVPLQSD